MVKVYRFLHPSLGFEFHTTQFFADYRMEGLSDILKYCGHNCSLCPSVVEKVCLSRMSYMQNRLSKCFKESVESLSAELFINITYITDS